MSGGGRAREGAFPCDLCGGRAFRDYAPAIYRAGAESFGLVRCRSCTLVQVRPLPPDEKIAALYDDGYFEKDYDSCLSESGYFDNTRKLKERYGAILDELERLAGAGDLLEAGCAGGYFLDLARSRGWNVKGVEITAAGEQYARARLGLDVRRGAFPPAPWWDDESFDVVYMGHVLEHTPSPSSAAAEAARLLRPGGVFLVEVPTYIDSFYFRTLRVAVPALRKAGIGGSSLLRALKFPGPDETIPPYHLYEFRRATLAALLKKNGFHVERTFARVPRPDDLDGAKSFTGRLLKTLFRLLDFLARRWGMQGGNIAMYARKGI